MTLDPLFSPDPTERLVSQIQTMDEMLRHIQEVLVELRTYFDERRDLDRRVTELETTMSRLQSIIMDLKAPHPQGRGGDRLTTLEDAVHRLALLTEQQKEQLEHQAAQQNQSLAELRTAVRRPLTEDEPVIREIDDLMHPRK